MIQMQIIVENHDQDILIVPDQESLVLDEMPTAAIVRWPFDAFFEGPFNPADPKNASNLRSNFRELYRTDSSHLTQCDRSSLRWSCAVTSAALALNPAENRMP